MNKIEYVTGNALNPIGEGHKHIVHICNNVGGWGSGFVVAISRKWKKPEQQYRAWHKSGEYFKLGNIQTVEVDTEKDITIINMIAQNNHATGTRDYNRQYVDYDALRKCLDQVRLNANLYRDGSASIHMPRIGCGLGGGSWNEVEAIINETLISNGLKVTVYDLE